MVTYLKKAIYSTSPASAITLMAVTAPAQWAKELPYSSRRNFLKGTNNIKNHLYKRWKNCFLE